jgi:hypothetical protein
MIILILVTICVIIIKYICNKSKNCIESIDNKYLIVGNCEKCINNEQIDIIKNFEGSVIFLNDNIKYIDLNKNGIMVCNQKKIHECSITNKYHKMPIFVLISDNNFFNSIYVWFLKIMYQSDIVFTDVTSISKYFVNEKEYKLSTGLILIEYLLKTNKEVHIIGFDVNDTTIHGKMDIVTHNFEFEHKLINDYIESGLLKQITYYS